MRHIKPHLPLIPQKPHLDVPLHKRLYGSSDAAEKTDGPKWIIWAMS